MKAQRLALLVLLLAVSSANAHFDDEADSFDPISSQSFFDISPLLFSSSPVAVTTSAPISLPISFPISIPAQSNEDDNWGCSQWRNGSCVQCSFRFIQNGLTCDPVNPLCKTWDNTGKCLTCYAGYSVCAEGCAPSQTQFSDKNCKSFDSTGKCLSCSQGSYFRNGVCTQSNPNCKTSNQNSGNCQTCYAGYTLQVGQCVLVPLVPNNQQPSDLLCAQWNQSVCLKCSVSAYFSNGVCTQVNPLCQTFNNFNGACSSCYIGYNLNNGNCALAPQAPDNNVPTDLLCAQWNKQVCAKCSQGAFFRNGVCVQSDPLCKTFDQVFGSCTSCYGGYYLFNSQCLLTPAAPSNAPPSDLLCAKWNGTICQQCSVSAYFQNGVCVQSNPICRTFDNFNGACTSCYFGFALQGGACNVADNSGPTDPLCARWTAGICSQCSRGSYFSNGVCTQANTLCQTYNSNNGACTSCYSGYSLSNGNCVQSANPVNTSAPSDPNCARWNGAICQQCSSDSFFQNGVCVESDPLCRTWNRNNGNCLSCYKGYTLNGASCVQAANPIDNSVPSDVLCAQWSGSTCLRCSQKAYFSNGVCTQSDPLCKTYDNTYGNCLSCYNGYSLNNGRCAVSTSAPSDLLCAVWNGAVCQQCSKKAYFSNGVCVQSNPLCQTYDNNNGNCLSCYNGYFVNFGRCVANTSTPSDLLCAVWNGAVCQQCSKKAYFFNGVCTQVNTQCKTFNSFNGACLSCYTGYLLNNGACNLDTRQPSDLLCAVWNGLVCQQCSKTAYFRNGVCTQSNPQCKTFSSSNGNCLSCYSGYVLSSGSCNAQVQSQSQGPKPPSANFDIYCKKYSSGNCTSCFYGFALQNGKCVAAFDQVNCPS